MIELRNVANVFLGGKEPDTMLRLNGQPAAGLLVFKQSNANITQTADAVLPQVEKINAEMPAGFTLEPVIDQSRYVRETVDEVQHELILASHHHRGGAVLLPAQRPQHDHRDAGDPDLAAGRADRDASSPARR